MDSEIKKALVTMSLVSICVIIFLLFMGYLVIKIDEYRYNQCVEKINNKEYCYFRVY